MTGQDMKWRTEQTARIERELIRRATPDLQAAHCGGDCGDCNGCGPVWIGYDPGAGHAAGERDDP